MRPLLAAAALIAGLAVSPALASQPGEQEAPAPDVESPINHAAPRPVPMAVMNYEIFEATVDHADLPECPKALAKEGRFCRLVLHGELLHVFAFSEDADQPLQAVMEFPVEAVHLGE